VVFFLAAFFILFKNSIAYLQNTFTRADSLLGGLRPERTCFDVNFYRIFVWPDLFHKTLQGKTSIFYTVLETTHVLQLDLAPQFKIQSVLWGNTKLAWRRDEGAIFVTFPRPLMAGEHSAIEISYYGSPRQAVKPPWDGGFIWTRDSEGNPWVSTAVQNLGASAWWPCKDHASDEPDSVEITILAPKPLVAISNGKRTQVVDWNSDYKAYTYKVQYPINVYNVCLNIGDYVEIHPDPYVTRNGDSLDLRYYPLANNASKARYYLDEEVRPMLSCFEQFFGPFPFKKDGYRIVETPFAGMEHQSAIAYGNGYRHGYLGKDYSGIGLNFDFIIVHESGHEYWGNAVSGADQADLWIHESFCTYAEALYVECRYGKEKLESYMQAKRMLVKNDKPILPLRGVNAKGSSDMYAKGALMLHTIRKATGDDSLFLKMLRAVIDTFKYKTVHTDAIIKFMSKELGWEVEPICRQYLQHTSIPQFTWKKIIKKGKKGILCKWEADEKEFNLPVRFMLSNNQYWQTIYPNAQDYIFYPINIKKTSQIVWDLEGYYVKSLNLH